MWPCYPGNLSEAAPGRPTRMHYIWLPPRARNQTHSRLITWILQGVAQGPSHKLRAGHVRARPGEYVTLPRTRNDSEKTQGLSNPRQGSAQKVSTRGLRMVRLTVRAPLQN